MASNAIPPGINDLLRLSNEALAAATALGASLPLLINTAGDIGSNRGNLLQLEGSYQVTLGQLKGTRAALVTARANGAAFVRSARTWLEHTYGAQWSQDWRAVGYIHNSLALPRGDANLVALLERMSLHLGSNASLENPSAKVNVTAARATTLAAALTTALNTVNLRQQESVTNKSGRDTAKKALRKRLCGLAGELRQRLAGDDGRWRRFGLNLPSAPTVPAVPKNLTVNTHTPGEFFITCASARNATHYRFFIQRPGLDAEPVFVGNADEPMFHLTALTPGQAYLVFVSAANSGAESLLTKPVTALVRGEAAAVA